MDLKKKVIEFLLMNVRGGVGNFITIKIGKAF
jgi:hypothetical protein